MVTRDPALLALHCLHRKNYQSIHLEQLPCSDHIHLLSSFLLIYHHNLHICLSVPTQGHSNFILHYWLNTNFIPFHYVCYLVVPIVIYLHFLFLFLVLSLVLSLDSFLSSWILLQLVFQVLVIEDHQVDQCSDNLHPGMRYFNQYSSGVFRHPRHNHCYHCHHHHL